MPRPFQRHSAAAELRLKISEQGGVGTHLAGQAFTVKAKGHQIADAFPNVPFHRMQPVTAVGDVGDPDVFAGGQQIYQTLRQQGSQGDLKWRGLQEKSTVGRRGVNVDGV